MDRAEIIREKGTNRRQVLKGCVDKYTWHDIGSSFLPSDLLAAILYAQMERYDEIMNNQIFNQILINIHRISSDIAEYWFSPTPQKGIYRR